MEIILSMATCLLFISIIIALGKCFKVNKESSLILGTAERLHYHFEKMPPRIYSAREPTKNDTKHKLKAVWFQETTGRAYILESIEATWKQIDGPVPKKRTPKRKRSIK